MKRHDQHRRHDHDAAKERHLDPIQQRLDSKLVRIPSVLAAAFADVVGYMEPWLGLQGGLFFFDEVRVR